MSFPRHFTTAAVIATLAATSGCAVGLQAEDTAQSEIRAAETVVEVADLVARGAVATRASSRMVKMAAQVGIESYVDGCTTVSLGDEVTTFDYADCLERQGAVFVASDVLRPGPVGPELAKSLTEEEIDELDAAGEAAQEGGDVPTFVYSVEFDSFGIGGASLSGSVAFVGDDQGDAFIDLQSTAHDGSVSLIAMSGSWQLHDAGSPVFRSDMSGTMQDGDEQIDIEAESLDFSPVCRTIAGGAISLKYEGAAVEIRFSDDCTGCAEILVDGEAAGETCAQEIEPEVEQ